MDFFFHGILGLLISKLITGDYLLLAFVFAILPDLLGTSVHLYYRFRHSLTGWGKLLWPGGGRFFNRIDKFAYRITHSLFFVFIVSVFAFIFFKKEWLVFSLACFSHLLVDIPTHQGEFSQQPFWPFFNWRIKGKSWVSHPRMFILFWLLLIIALFKIAFRTGLEF